MWLQRLTGRLSKHDIQALAHELSGDKAGIEEVLGIVFRQEDAHTAMNAAWTLSWLSKPDKITYLSCHHHALIDFAMREDIKCRRGLILAILLDMPDAEEPRTDFLDYCLNEFANEQQHDSCRSSMIKMAVRMCAPYQELQEELCQRLEILPPGLPPSISCAKRKALSTSCRRKRNKNR